MTADLRYPVGQFVAPASVTLADRAAAIKTLAEAPARLRLAIANLSEAQLDTPYRPGGWTVRQVIHHVADSHLNAYLRAKFALSQDTPTIMPYPEATWAELPDGRTGPVWMSLHILDGLHARWVMLLSSISREQWQRAFVHPELGPMSLDDQVVLYDWHSRHHIAHITALRSRMNW